MRASHWLLGLATSSAVVAVIVSGCGGSNASNPSDSGAADVTTDVTEAAAKEAAAETGPEAAAEAAPCVPDAMIGTITIPDSGLGEGGSTAACLSCVQTACPMLISQCNMTCGCPEAFTAFEACVAAGTSLLTCGGALAGAANLPPSDLTCAAACLNSCGVTLPGDGGGEGGDSATDSPTDSPTDAPGQ